MIFDTDARLADLLATIRAAVDASELDNADKITVSENGTDAANAYDRTAGAIIVYPIPAIEWPAPKVVQAIWSIGVVALSGDSKRANAARLTQLIGLVPVTSGDKATPTDFKVSETESVPGYTITHTEEWYV